MSNLATKSGRSIELAKIHIGATKLGMIRPGDDSAYRDMLWSIGRVRSAKDLDAGGRQAVLEHLSNCGFKDRQKLVESRYEKGTQAALIRWLWTQLFRAGKVRNSSDRSLRRYIAQHSGIKPGVDEIAPQHLSVREANAVIEQLKSWDERSDRSLPE